MQGGKNLGLKELIAIAIGGMVGGGIFTILGISPEQLLFIAMLYVVLTLGAWGYANLR